MPAELMPRTLNKSGRAQNDAVFQRFVPAFHSRMPLYPWRASVFSTLAILSVINKPLMYLNALFLRRFAVATVLVVSFAATLRAGSVSYQFEATIHTIAQYGNPSFALPFDVMVGDVIHGQVTLPEQSENGSHQVLLELMLGGVTLNSSQYEFAVLDNISTQLKAFTYEASYVGPIEVIPPDVLRLANTGISPLYDATYLFCSPTTGTTCPPDAVPGTGAILWQPVVNLTGPNSTLLGDRLPGDALQWNTFTARALQLGFVANTQRAGSIVLTASLGQFSAVPEPSLPVYAACFMALLLPTFGRSVLCAAD